MKKRYLIILLVLICISCQGFDKEQRIAERIQKSVNETFTCNSVNILSEVQVNVGKKLTVEIETNQSIDLNAKAEEIISALEDDIPEVSENEEIIIRFVDGEAYEEFNFEGKGNRLEREDYNMLHLSGVVQ